MAWMSDEKYEYIQDCRDKKITARSARNVRTHCGKRGAVKFPSDYMTKKEREAMNGECKSYRMNDPINWEEFKSWPKEHQETYIKLLRKKFNVPLTYISEIMFGMDRTTLSYHAKQHNLKLGDIPKGHRTWDKEGFMAWCGGAKNGIVKPSETTVEDAEEEIDISKEDELIAVNEEPEIVTINLEEDIGKEAADKVESLLREVTDAIITVNNAESKCETKTVIPSCGEMTFQGNVDDILRTIAKLLDGRQVRLEVEWEVLG